MLSPLSRGFGTWTGNYDPYNEDGADSDSLPDIEEPHRHGITVGFVSRTPSATLVSPPFRTTSSHVREATLSASTHYAREATLSGKRNGSGREVLFADPMSRENSDSQMNLPKTFLTRKGALMLFAADEDELDSLPSKTDVHPRLMRIRKPVDVIDTSLKLGTMDKLTMSVLQFGEEEALKENSSVTDDKNKLFMKFLNKVDDRDVDKRAQPGGDVKYYLSDLKHKTSLQMGLSRDTALPRSREALELRAILRGLQEDGSWPMTYRQAGADFKRPSGLAEQFSRPASHLHHPPRNQNQRILSSDKLEDSVKSLRSYLGRSLDTLNENGVPLLTRRRAKHREGDVDSVKRSKYAREPTDEDFRRHRSHRPHTNTPTRDQDIHGDDEESRDKLGEIIDPRLPRDDRGRIEMIDNEDLNLHFTKTSTPFPPPTPTNAFDESESSSSNNLSPVKDKSTKLQIAENQMVPDSTQETVSSNIEEKQTNLSRIDSVSSTILEKKASSIETVKNKSSLITNVQSHTYNQEQKQNSVQSNAYEQEQVASVQSHVNDQEQEDLKTKTLKPESKKSEIESIHAEIEERIKSSSPSNLRERSPSQNSMKEDESSLNLSNIKPEPTKGDESGIKIQNNANESETSVLVRGDNLDETPKDINLDNSAEIPHPTTPRSTDIATEDKLSPRAKSESSSKLGEKIEEDHGPETLVSITEDKFVQKKAELPTIPDYLKPKPQSKPQSKPQAKKDQKKKGQLTKGKKEDKTAKTPVDVTKAIDITSVQPEEQDEITQIIKKKVTLPPEIEQSIMPDFVTEAINRSKERSKQQLEEEFAEKQRMIEKEIGVTSYEGEGMTAEELELEKKELKKREELAKEKILKGKPQKKMDEKSKKSGGSSSIRSKKSKGGAKDPLQLEKERIRALKEQEKLQRMEEIRALEEKIAAQSNSMSADDKKFKDKLQEVQMELERIEREAYMAEQTEADVRQALREERMKRMEEKAKLKKEELARKRQQLIDRKQQEKQLKEEARQRELQKIMMLMDDEERKKRQEEERLKKEEDEKEEENKRKEMEEEFARQEREEEERRRQLEEEIEQEELRRIQVEQDEIRKQQEVVQAQKEALLEEQRRKRELAALEEQRHVEELDRKQQEELKRQAEERARINELLQLEEEVRERMKQDTEKRREEAIQRRDTNIDAKSNLNKIRHSQGINRAFVFSYFINWPMETYMRPVGEQEKKKKEAKLREKRKKAR
ncbi:golgin subfamily A member 6-like protein 22 isoform X2 [Mytilus californianus]|uniref:golgin subfamily A member 6-like protein 22 isoform X2 n=1 Tax=Mytilus californianus TaxID=6549 RepID=UPI0022476942|nr:golgin subfamily A member 6-like protein 22 isoform X2 [Mytilus californianus]